LSVQTKSDYVSGYFRTNITSQSIQISSDFSTSNTCFEDITDLTLTVEDRDGEFFAVFTSCMYASVGANVIYQRLTNGVTQQQAQAYTTAGVGIVQGLTESAVGALDGRILQMQGRVSANTGIWSGTFATDLVSRGTVTQIG